jgi:arylsulfatase A-like enzyme
MLAPRRYLRSLLLAVIVICRAEQTIARADETVPARPNILVILVDDMGYSDPACFGGELETPSLDQLAKEGVRLARFYNGGMCVVSRAMMLTGQWWPKALPNFSKQPLISERLHDANYRTALIGKWHLDGHPMDRGFDHFFGFLAGFADHFAGAPSYRLDREPFNDFGDRYYSTDAFSDRAIEFIRSTPEEKPFFLYLSFQAPHNPLQAPEDDIPKQRGKYLKGWQAIRDARYKRQQQLGIVPENAKQAAYPQNLPDWDSLSPEQRDLEDLRMATYAAMVERIDQGIGRVMAGLKESGRAKDTLVIFMSDNGADSFSVVDQAMLKQEKLPGDRGSNWQPGTGWAYASVTPWRLYKISQHAGGVTTGAIVRWPHGMTAEPGRIVSSAVHMVDVHPTLLEVAGIPSTTRDGEDGRLDGESFLPLLQQEAWQRKGDLFFQYMDNRAIRTSDWTLAEVDGAGWELFNMQTDPLETIDLAAKHPDVVIELEARWLHWWRTESGKEQYEPTSTKTGPHYNPQGDRGTAAIYVPSAMPTKLAGRYPVP